MKLRVKAEVHPHLVAPHKGITEVPIKARNAVHKEIEVGIPVGTAFHSKEPCSYGYSYSITLNGKQIWVESVQDPSEIV